MPASLFSHIERSGRETRPNRMLAETIAFDWAATPAGPLESWPETLKVAARTVLSASAPMTLLIGPERRLLYNDAVRAIFGADYEASLGRSIFDVLPHARDFYRDAVEACLAGAAARHEDQPLSVMRDGARRTAWFDLDFIPLLDEAGAPQGVLLISNETTEKRRTAQDLRRVQERLSVALDAAGIVGIWDLQSRGGLLFGDARLAELFGLSPADLAAGVDPRRILANIHPEDVPRAARELAASEEGIAPDRSQYRIVDRDGAVRWLVVSGRRVAGDGGDAGRMTGIAVDITAQIELARALEESELRFYALAETLPQHVFSTDAGGRHDFFNGRWFEFTGLPRGAGDGEKWIEFLHPDDRRHTFAAWRECLRTGARYDVEYRYRRHDGEYRWMRVMAQPLRDKAGRIARWFGTATDIHDSKLMAAERELIAGELNHRIKNLFAVVAGLISLSARGSAAHQPFADELIERLTALSLAHDVIAPRAGHAAAASPSLHALLHLLLKPYDGPGGQRCSFAGPDLEISAAAATPLALIVHELATNAAKYGALSAHGGEIEIRTRLDDEWLRVTWRENWPARAEATRPGEGFGSLMLATVVERQLRGRFDRRFRSDGLDVEIALPLARVAARPAD